MIGRRKDEILVEASTDLKAYKEARDLFTIGTAVGHGHSFEEYYQMCVDINSKNDHTYWNASNGPRAILQKDAKKRPCPVLNIDRYRKT